MKQPLKQKYIPKPPKIVSILFIIIMMYFIIPYSLAYEFVK